MTAPEDQPAKKEPCGDGDDAAMGAQVCETRL